MLPLGLLLVLAAVGTTASSGAAIRPRMDRVHGRCSVPGVGETLGRAWHPDIRSAVRYIHGRLGDIAFAVRTPTSFYGYRFDYPEWSASVLKAMLLVAYLDRRSVAARPLNAQDRALLSPMITWSDNDAADTVDEIVGASGLWNLAHRVGMNRFVAAEPIWGESEITARDQTRFFLNIDRYIVARHRAYAMRLLNSIVPSQRWGIGQVAPRGWQLYFKGGWGSGTGLIDHQVALLTRGCARVSIAVLTMDDGSHAYGQQTLKVIFHDLLKGLPEGPRSRYR